MHYRRLGRCPTPVSEIGFGAWGIGGVAVVDDAQDGTASAPRGWTSTSDEESVRALERALDLGVNFIDTALGYGGGRSEQIVGRIVRDRTDDVVVATKVSPKSGGWPMPAGVDPDDVFPADWVHECVQRSLRNTGLDTLGLLQLHVWSDDWVGRGSWLQALESLKAAGTVRMIGVSLNNHQPASGIRLVETGVIDTVQVIYNIFDQSPEDELLPACEANGVGVIARVPFDEGALTGRIKPDSEFPEGDFRNEYFRGDRRRQVFERVEAIRSDLEIEADDMAEVALRFVLSHSAVSTVIPGMRSVRNVERNVLAGDGRGLPDDQVARLRPHRWLRDFY